MTEVPLPEGRLFTAIIRDISERKQFQSQLAAAERQRAVLTRHFSPNMVDELMQAGGRSASCAPSRSPCCSPTSSTSPR